MGFWDWLGNWFKSLTVTSEGDGQTSPKGISWWLKGSRIKLWAFPNKDREFVGWSGDLTGSSNPADVVMMVNKTIRAVFTQILNTLGINIEGQGSVVKSPDQPAYVPGTQVTLTATPAAGWQFSHWTFEDGSEKTENPTVVTA